MGNYVDSKKKYGEVLEMKPTNKLRGITMNNLAVACWWHKNPLYKDVITDMEYEEARINRDFKQTKELLMNAVGAL